ncbi:MAG: permease [Pontiella sp.]
MTLLLNILKEIWLVTVEMAPYLLFGFLMAGILSVLISRDYVRRHLGGRSWIGAFKAALIGVPMPICSCGVIPLAATLRKQGASRSATASFLASTPQTGIDSLMITYALLGWVFALFRALVAFISGILCGVAVAAISEKEDEPPSTDETPPLSSSNHPHILVRMLKYGFISLPKDISKSMVLGIIISGIISGLIPVNFFADYLGDSPWAMLLMLVIGIPLYVCSSASVPIALAFIKAGLSPGAALVFLITGPATNAATLTTLWKIIGKKQLVVFLSTLALCALAAGFIMNQLAPSIGLEEQLCQNHEQTTGYHLLYAAVLIVILLKGMWPESKKKESNCE